MTDLSRRAFLAAAAAARLPAAAPPDPLAWVAGVSRMGFGTPGDAPVLARMGAQVLHTNAVWPYFPLRRDGGDLPPHEKTTLAQLAASCRRLGLRLSLGLPPFMPVALVRKHPDWRERRPGHTPGEPKVDDLGTRAGCNNGPWGNYLIEVCAELAADFGLDGFSFDGNYHPPLCHCEACTDTYKADAGRALPANADLANVEYREYLVWRGDRLVAHYRRLKERLARARPGTAIMTWTVNAGRYGHLLHSPRAMPVALNRVFDLPMQEWWLDETNVGASVAPAFGAAYLRAVTDDRPCASEPYLMSRGNPYGTDSFPHHERLARTLLALTHGSAAAHSVGWAGHRDSTGSIFASVKAREAWLLGARRLPWAAMLVSEQTRQFHAWQDIPGRFLPPVFGAFRAAMEGHRPLSLLTDDDVIAGKLSAYAVLILPGAAALSDRQVAAIRAYVRGGGGLVASGDASLCDHLGRPRRDFALADLFGVSYQGVPGVPAKRPGLDVNFALTLGADYWRQRVGLARLRFTGHPLGDCEALTRLVPGGNVQFRGPLTLVSEPAAGEVAWRLTPEGAKAASPGGVARTVAKGRVVYLASSLDAALWSYAYPYQRHLFLRAVDWAARSSPPVRVRAPLCVQATFWRQQGRTIVQLFNNVNTSGGHGLPSAEVPLREETLPVHDIWLTFTTDPGTVTVEPGRQRLRVSKRPEGWVVTVPRLDLHAVVVAGG